MRDPRAMSGESSTMPNYPWLFDQKFDIDSLPRKIAAQRTLGVPYPPMPADEIKDQAKAQAIKIHEVLKGQNTWVEPDREIIALVAYLKKLGTWEAVKGGETGPPEVPPVFIPGNPDEHRDTITNNTYNH
jgi:cytochrome c oxidase cbb3-type subunit I/II